MSQELPEGVINAEPAGGWESGDVADAETRERSRADAAEAGLPSDRATGYDVEAAEDVESAEATQGIDPDLAGDEDVTEESS
jgi:hypothetical protein